LAWWVIGPRITYWSRVSWSACSRNRHSTAWSVCWPCPASNRHLRCASCRMPCDVMRPCCRGC